MDDPAFVSPDPAEHGMPPAGKSATEGEQDARAEDLPGDHGQFGTDVATERYRSMKE